MEDTLLCLAAIVRPDLNNETTAQDELAYASAVEMLDAVRDGRWTAADVEARGWSTYQLCLLEVAFGHPGDAWRSMSAEQRNALRIHAPVVAKAAEERASASTTAETLVESPKGLPS